MTPWYEKSFGRNYLEIYAHRNIEEAGSDIRHLDELIGFEKDEPLLDLGCGPGRHLLALQRAGFKFLVGLDLSAELLREAAGILPPSPHGITSLVRGDMRYIPFRNCFATVLSIFTSFGYFDLDRENEQVIKSVWQAMKQGGIFLMDYMNRHYTVANLVDSDEMELAGFRVQNFRSLTEDGRRIEKRMKVLKEGEEGVELFESVRLYTSEEFVDMLKLAGFEDIRCYGSLKGERLSADSERLVVVGRKRGDA